MPHSASSETPNPKTSEQKAAQRKRRRLALWVLMLLVGLGLWVQRCWLPLPLPPELGLDTLNTYRGPEKTFDTAAVLATPVDSVPTPIDSQPRPATAAKVKKIPSVVPETTLVKTALPEVDTTTPYVFADPWGGRHFDSVTVRLVCRESCLVLYSLQDTAQFRTYDAPLTFRRNTTLWVAGVRGDGTRLEPLRIDYVIERNRGLCPKDMVSFSLEGEERCMDQYEWPNREDASPQAFVSWREAQDSCTRIGKRLCTLEEWQAVCTGPEKAKYPYSAPYDERYCPAKEAGPSHSGHFPVCRSYYGSFDMTGNLWEWTSTPHPTREGFYQVAGGNWEGGDQATCKFTRYSFYPQNRFPMVGFRCCDSAH